MIREHTTIRFAERADSALIIEFVRALAEYEHLLDTVTAAEDEIARFIFDDGRAEVVLCEYDGEAAGFALFFTNFSTFLGKPGIFIEDLFVKPEFRGRGLGKLMLSFLARLVKKRGFGRLEWACLDWNEPSIRFYKAQGASPLSQWTTYRVSGDKLTALAAAGEFGTLTSL